MVLHPHLYCYGGRAKPSFPNISNRSWVGDGVVNCYNSVHKFNIPFVLMGNTSSEGRFIGLEYHHRVSIR
jgi:hypothetical protein